MNRILLIIAVCGMGWGQSSRQYYDELYKAGGLDRLATQYACFPDEEKGVFKIFSTSEYIRDGMKMTGYYRKLTPAERRDLAKGFLYARTYDHGTANKPEYYEKEADDSYVLKGDLKSWPGFSLRVTYRLNWATLRYHQILETFKKGSPTPTQRRESYGRCEVIDATIKQTGD
jgi:hypothetical protein